MKLEYEVQGGDFAHAGSASSQVKRILKQINLEHGLIKRIVVALYEAEVNIVAHTYRGRISIDIDVERILIRLADEGPGIPDIDLAMQEGYSTASPEVREMGFGAGMGLSNIKKNADELAIESEVGKGTTVTILIKFKEGT